MKRLAIRTIVLVFVIALVIEGIAWAGSSSRTGTLDNRTWVAELGIPSKGLYTWIANISASMNPEPRDPKVVGWYWWTTREYCGSNIVYQLEHGGGQDTSSPFTYVTRSYTDVYHTQCGDHYLSSYARFDFKSNWQEPNPVPQFEYKERRGAQ